MQENEKIKQKLYEKWINCKEKWENWTKIKKFQENEKIKQKLRNLKKNEKIK